MAERQIKSKQRVAEHGEVFTARREVNAMLDLVQPETERIGSRFLDPACGEGAFLAEILRRKLAAAKALCRDDLRDYERYAAAAVADICGVDILPDNVDACREKLFAVWAREYAAGLKARADGQCREAVRSILRENILCGDALAMRRADGSPMVFPGNPCMRFDVIIGNPPYHLRDGGAQASARPVYHRFVEMAKKLRPRYLVMIIPARWYTGGKGLEAFRREMLSDTRIEELHDFPDPRDCFPGVNIRGGICYFKWSRDRIGNNSLTKVTTHNGSKITVSRRRLKLADDMELFVRYSPALSVIRKVHRAEAHSISEYVSPLRPFGLRGYFSKDERFHADASGLSRPIICFAKGGAVGYVEREDIPRHHDWIDRWKVFIPRADNIGTELNDDNLNAFVGGPGTVCTESFLVLGAELALDQARCENLSSYLKTRFARFMHSVIKVSQDATAKTWRLVPVPELSRPWTDEELYAIYGLTQEETAFIRSMIKPMG